MREWQRGRGRSNGGKEREAMAMAVAEAVERGIGETLVIVTDRAW